jgi:hypothetical protein
MYTVAGGGYVPGGFAASVTWTGGGSTIHWSVTIAGGGTEGRNDVWCLSANLTNYDFYHEKEVGPATHLLGGHYFDFSGLTYSGSYDCGAGNFAAVRVAAVNPDGTVTDGFISPGSVAVTTASTCTNFSAVSASYVGGSLAVYFKWSGSAPAAGWKVYAPGDGSAAGVGASQLVVSPSGTGTPGEFGASAPVTLGAAPASVRVQSGSAPGCYAAVAPSLTSEVTGTVPDTGTDSGGFACGLNPFCYIGSALRSAFVPSSSTAAAFTTHLDDIKGRAPVSFVIAGGTFLVTVATDSGCPTGTTMAGGACSASYGATLGADIAPAALGAPGAHLDALNAAGALASTSYGPYLRTGLVLMFWSGFVFWAWRRVSDSFGGRG